MGEWDIVEQKNIGVQKPGRIELGTEWQVVKKQPISEIDKAALERAGFEAVGGMAGGAIATAVGQMGPQALLPEEAITVPAGIGLGSAIGGQIHDLYKEITGQAAPKPLIDRAIKSAEDTILNIIAPEGISKGFDIAKKTGRAMVQPFRKGAGTLADYQLHGIRPSAGAISGNKGIQLAEKTLSDFPTSAGTMQRAAAESMEDIERATDLVSRQYGLPKTVEEMGTALKKGAKKAIEKFDSIADNLFTRVSQEIGETTIPVDNTMAEFNTIISESVKGGPPTGISKLFKDFEGKSENGLGYESLRKWRSRIGDMLKDPQLVSTRNIGQGELKRLYGAMSKDLEQAATNAGPKTLAKYQAANKYYRLAMENKIPILDEIIKKGYDEEAFNVAMKSAKEGSGRLKALKRQMPNDEWNALSGTVLGRMGLATPGQQTSQGAGFSINTFLTNWNKLSPEAKNALFGNAEYIDARISLDSLMRIVGDFKNVEKMANMSKSGSAGAFLALLMGTGTATAVGGAKGFGASAVMGGMAPYGMAKLMTWPKFIKWLSKGAKIAKTSPNSMPTHLAKLAVLAENEKHGEDIKDLIRETGIDQWAPDLKDMVTLAGNK